ncbi:MAG: glycosyltransferase family 4 protein [Anaerolineae bacterium]
MYVALNAWFWDQPATGSGQYVRHLLPALAALEPETRFGPVVPGGTEIQCSEPNIAPLETSDLELRTSDLYKLWFEQVAFRRATVKQGADVAHIPYFASPAFPTMPTVVTVHDLIPMVLPAYRRSALVRAYTWLVAAGARRADAIIADSQCSKRDIVAHLKVKPQRVHVIPLAASPQFHPATSGEVEQARRRYRLPDRYALYLGGFDQRKNVGALLRAFAQVQAGGFRTLRLGSGRITDLGLVIAGRLPVSDTDFTPDPQRIAAQLGIEESVVFPGWIDEQDKPALYSGAELFVFPSTYEGFGLPVLEAMACGTPVVTSSTSSLPEVVGEAGLAVDPDDINALAQAISAVLGDAERRQAMRQTSLSQAGRFSWERTAKATHAVYEDIT